MRRSRIAVALVLLVSLATTTTAIANIFAQDGVDPRRPWHPGDAPGYDAVVRMESQRLYPDPNPLSVDAKGHPLMVPVGSSGFLVSPCFAMNNFHSVTMAAPDGITNFAPGSPDVTLVHLNVFVNGHYGAPDAVATPVVWGPYMLTGRSGDDWVLLKLEALDGRPAGSGCLGLEMGWVEFDLVRESLPTTSNMYVTAGYPGDMNDSVLRIDDSGCQFYLRDSNEMTVATDCSTQGGQSGSPIGYLDTNGVLNVVAVNSYSRHLTTQLQTEFGQGEYASMAIGEERFYLQIRETIMADKERHKVLNPAARTASVIAARKT